MSAKETDKDDAPLRIQGERPDPDTESWYEYTWRTQQETPARLEECAKFLSGVIAITLTLFLTAGKDAFESQQLSGWAGTALGLWLISLVLCLLVLFPWHYRFRDDSVESIKKMHGRVVKVKYGMLAGAIFLFLVALVILTCLFFRP